jgi:D-xylonolactonase
MEPRLIADYACHTGEGPLWDPDKQRVYWTDIPNGRIFLYTPATGVHEICYEGEQVGGMTLQDDGALLLFMERGAIKIWDEGRLTTVIEDIAEERDSRFNDVIADPVGRVFCGTMPTPDTPGRLYRLETDGTIQVVLEGIGCSNGMGFTPDRRQMYFTDSAKQEIYLFDYAEESGALTNQRVFVRTEDDGGWPDGMTVDADGNVWSTRWDGGCVVQYSPDGEEMRRVAFPAKKVSCVTFGGPNYTDMYVTTAGGYAKDTDGELAGSLLHIDLGIRGVPEFRSRVRLDSQPTP